MADGFYTEHVSAGVLSEPSLDRVSAPARKNT